MTTLPLDTILRMIETDGYVLFRNRSYRVGEWSADLALEALGITREQAMEMPEVNAAAIGLDLRHEIGRAFLERWYEHAREGLARRARAGLSRIVTRARAGR